MEDAGQVGEVLGGAEGRERVPDNVDLFEKRKDILDPQKADEKGDEAVGKDPGLSRGHSDAPVEPVCGLFYSSGEPVLKKFPGHGDLSGRRSQRDAGQAPKGVLCRDPERVPPRS